MSWTVAGVPPETMGIGPVPAVTELMQRTGLTLADIDLIEVNEAFAVVAWKFIRDLDLDPEKVNVFGGSVAIGHPLGCSGARIITTLTTVLKEKKAKIGCAGICNGGGGASALVIENLQ